MSHAQPSNGVWVDNFSDGFIDTPEQHALPPGASPSARNGFLYKINLATRQCTMGRRGGSRLINETALASQKRIDGLFDFRRPGASAVLLAMCNGQLSSVNPVTGATASIGAAFGTAGNQARMTPFRSNAFLYDGSAQKRYDGTSLYDIGFAAPSSVTNMAAGAGTLTGTYEAKYTWYNENMDHDSSVSDVTATLALVGQGRTHTKPGGAVPAAATHWRAWVRRTDTNELNYYLAATETVATASATETVSDAARQVNTIADRPSVNDPPPGNFIALFEMNGFGFGILANSDSVYVSKIGDLESWHPRDKFPISRAVGDALVWGREFAERKLVGTDHGTWELEGDKVPFKVRRLHSTYGNVSQDAHVEVDGIGLFGWDRVRGPYLTDLVTWTPIADSRITTFVGTIKRSALASIRCVHDEQRNLVIWAVPTTSTRVRTLLAYHYLLGTWLPPITGLEYGSLCQFTDTDGALGLFYGDYWGRVYELFSGARDGPPSGDVTATVTSSTNSTVTCTGAAFYTTGSGLAGMPVAVKSPAGVWQWRRIESNTADVITLDTTNDAEWTTNPEAGWELYVGGIEWYWLTPFLDFRTPIQAKKGYFVYAQLRATEVNLTLYGMARFNDADGNITEITDLDWPIPVAGAIWGESLWGEGIWGGSGGAKIQKQRLDRTFQNVQFRFWNYEPDADVQMLAYGVATDEMIKRLVPSVNG